MTSSIWRRGSVPISLETLNWKLNLRTPRRITHLFLFCQTRGSNCYSSPRNTSCRNTSKFYQLFLDLRRKLRYWFITFIALTIIILTTVTFIANVIIIITVSLISSLHHHCRLVITAIIVIFTITIAIVITIISLSS